MTVAEIARLLDAPYEGGGERLISGGAALDSAGESEIAFVEDSVPERVIRGSRAGCLLTPSGRPAPPGRTAIVVPKPRNAFIRVLRELHPPHRPAAGVHPRAEVAQDAQLGEGVSAGPYAAIEAGARIGPRTVIAAGAHIGRNSVVGADCQVHARVVVYHDVRIGDRVSLHAGCVIGADGFGYALEGGRYEKFPQIGGVEIANDVEIGANACVDRGALGDTVIGEGTKLDNLVHIGHNCRLGKHVVIAAQTGLSGGVVVEDYVVMGGQVGISEKARIGAKAVVGAQCGILPYKKLEAGETFWGTPSRPHREHLQRLALVNRLPKLFKEVEELRRRLNSAKGDE